MMFLIGGSIDQIFDLITFHIDKDEKEWTTGLGGFFGGIWVFATFVTPELSTLSAWLYLRFELKAPANWQDANRLSPLFTIATDGKWFPLTEIKKLDKDVRLLAVYAFAEKVGRLYTPPINQPTIFQKNKKARLALLISVAFLSVAGGVKLAYENGLFDKQYVKYITSASNYFQPKKQSPTYEYPPISLPYNGTIRLYTKKKRIAPLKINTSGQHHYFVKLTDSISGKDVLSVFIRSGQSVDIEVPLGEYYLKYAAGVMWYGENKLFGTETRYSKADQKFVFYQSSNEISGYTVELILQSGGNLRTKKIGAAEW